MVLKALTISCLLAAASIQAAFAQNVPVLIAPEDLNSTDTTAPTSNATTTRLMAAPTLPILQSVQVLVDNNLEVDGANFPFVVLPDNRFAKLSANACGRLGEGLYSAQSRALPSVQKMLSQAYPNITEFWVDNGSSDPNYLTKCDTLVMDNGVASIKTGGSCLRLLPSLCSNINTNGKVTVQTSLGRITGARDKFGFRFKGIRYAKAPTGALRFAAPVPITAKWTNTIEATQFGAMCPQTGGGDEDCLFLNVFTPKLNAADTALLPVMF